MASIQAFHCAPESPKWAFPVMLCSSSWIDSWMKITMRCPLWTFWRRQARGQEVPSAATARMVVRQMVGRYAASATDQRSPRLSGRPEFADQTAAKRKWDVRVQQPGPTAGSWSEPWCGLNSSTSQQMDDAGDGGTHINDQKDPSEPKRNRGELFWDAAEQNAEADNREGAGSIWALSRSFSSTRRRSSAVFSSSVRLSSTPTRGQISDHTHGDDLFAARCLLALGLVTLYLLRRLPRVDEVSRHWRAAFAWAAGTALAGV